MLFFILFSLFCAPSQKMSTHNPACEGMMQLGSKWKIASEHGLQKRNECCFRDMEILAEKNKSLKNADQDKIYKKKYLMVWVKGIFYLSSLNLVEESYYLYCHTSSNIYLFAMNINVVVSISVDNYGSFGAQP